jgi:hypothetical protein
VALRPDFSDSRNNATDRLDEHAAVLMRSAIDQAVALRNRICYRPGKSWGRPGVVASALDATKLGITALHSVPNA